MRPPGPGGVAPERGYALQVMLYLAGPDGQAPGDDIAESEKIPPKYLEHVMPALKAHGIVAEEFEFSFDLHAMKQDTANA